MLAFAMTAINLQAQGSVFGYTHQGTTLYYIIDSTGDAMLVSPMWPEYDEENDEVWLGYTKPVGAVTVPDSVSFAGSNYAVTRVGNDALYNCTEVTSVTLPSAITALGTYAFSKCYNLTSFTIPEGVTDIPHYCFFRDTMLASVYIPTGVTDIGAYAFADCHSLQEISIPGSVHSIGFWSFGYCRNLASVVLNEGVDTIGYASFNHCVNLSHIVIPSTLKAICDFAFQYDSALCIDLVLPEAFTTLGQVAFGDCVSLPSVTLPGTMTKIPAHTFRQCASLATATLGEGITTIEAAAFAGCTHLRKVMIPSTLDTIRTWAFINGMPDTIVLRCAMPPATDDSVFSDYNSLIVVPCGATTNYRKHEKWSHFANIEEDCSGIEEIDNSKVKIEIIGHTLRVENPDCENVEVYDITGRPLPTANCQQPVVNYQLPTAGVYLLKVGSHYFQKIMVINN